MTGYGARAVPWTRIALAAGLVVVLMELVRSDPWTLWPLQGAAVGLMAGASAWCFDETAAVVVDAAPRGLTWRTMARAPGLLLLLVIWTAVVLHDGGDTTFGHRNAVWVQGLVAALAGAAYGTWRRSCGEASPGLAFGNVLVPTATAWALLRPLDGQLSVFPYGTTTSSGWEHSSVGWLVLGLCAVAALCAALGEARWWSLSWQARRAHSFGQQTNLPLSRHVPGGSGRTPVGGGARSCVDTQGRAATPGCCEGGIDGERRCDA